MACCPRCHRADEVDVPLICTLAFSGAEFYCLECGGRFGWLDPIGRKPTEEITAHQERLQAEWDEHAGKKLLTRGAWHQDCEKCKPGGETHLEHATDEEKAAHEEAMAWLAERVKVPA